MQEIIILLRDDYHLLMSVFGVAGEILKYEEYSPMETMSNVHWLYCRGWIKGELPGALNRSCTRLVQEGGFVVIESGEWLFYGLVTDLQLGATDPRFADEQSEVRFPAKLAQLLHGQTLFTTLEVLPALMLEQGPDPEQLERIPPGLKPSIRG